MKIQIQIEIKVIKSSLEIFQSARLSHPTSHRIQFNRNAHLEDLGSVVWVRCLKAR